MFLNTNIDKKYILHNLNLDLLQRGRQERFPEVQGHDGPADDLRGRGLQRLELEHQQEDHAESQQVATIFMLTIP